MPELPEVETVVRDLRRMVIGREITGLIVSRKPLRLPWKRSWNPDVIGQSIVSITRRGKWIVVALQPSGRRLLIHLGMTGQLTSTDSNSPRLDHTHLSFRLTPGDSEIRFRDVRRFGSARLFSCERDLNDYFRRQQLGPEPFELERDYWLRSLAKTSRCLKAVLLDQRVVAGIGNIYGDEALFEAGLHPARIGNQIRAVDADRLRDAVTSVLLHAIRRRGSTIRDYIGGSGLRGEYQHDMKVYGRTGDPCRKCRTPIVRVRLAGRSTHFCPQCQPLH
jgi:formamidopyrimidine-DNA glycosylase